MSVYLTLAASYGFAGAAMPGPLAAFLISSALAHGWRRTAPAAFSPLLTDGPIALLVLVMLTRVPESFVQVLRLLGGLFLLYLAWQAFSAWRRFDLRQPEPAASSRSTLLKAIGVNLLNPNPYIGWSLVMGPLFLQGWASSPAAGLAVLIGFYGSLVGTMLAIIAVFSLAGDVGPKVNRVLLGLSSLGLASFAAYQFWLWVG